MLGSGAQAANYCVRTSGVTDQPPANFTLGRCAATTVLMTQQHDLLLYMTVPPEVLHVYVHLPPCACNRLHTRGVLRCVFHDPRSACQMDVHCGGPLGRCLQVRRHVFEISQDNVVCTCETANADIQLIMPAECLLFMCSVDANLLPLSVAML